MCSCKFIIFKVELCLTLPKPHNPLTALTERRVCTNHCSCSLGQEVVPLLVGEGRGLGALSLGQQNGNAP